MEHTSGNSPAPGSPAMGGSEMGSEMQACIQNCLTCHSTCVVTLAHCLEVGGAHVQAAHLRLLLDCAEICQTSANFMLRGSALHQRTCGVCAEACTQCAEACANMGDDSQMQACAVICRQCADSCRRMAA